MCRQTLHACALEINQTGILIRGKSGTGKTSLMMGLLERAKNEGLTALMVADDQVLVNSTPEGICVKVPKSIAGAIEIRGYGIIQYPNKEQTHVNLVVDMVRDETVERMPEQKFCVLEGSKVPLLEVPERHESQAVRIVFAWLAENADLHVA